jgi:hypothetical protein
MLKILYCMYIIVNGYRVLRFASFQHTKPFFRITMGNILIFEVVFETYVISFDNV